ncbi:hypothetical protein FQZ97_1225570 [compost metagenome]
MQARTLHRLIEVEAQPGGFDAVLADRPGLREHEAHASVRQVQAYGHLGQALVRALSDPEPAADALTSIDQMDVAALVEEGMRFDRMIEVVLRSQPANRAVAAGVVHISPCRPAR